MARLFTQHPVLARGRTCLLSAFCEVDYQYMDIQSGNIIQGLSCPEPVEVKHTEDLGDYIYIVGANTHSRTHVDTLPPP